MILEEKMAAEGPTSRSGQAWFCTTGLPSDVIIEVDEMGFHLHKFPLMSKSRKLCQMIEEERERKGLSRRRGAVRFMDPSDSEQENVGEDEEEEECHIVLPDFPGGSDAFEVAAKFCYGVKLALTASTVAAVRCAAEYLEMTEEFSDDNLILKAERFISHSVLRNVKNILRMLSSCQGLLPTAENLGIVQRCIESIAAKVAVADPSLFGWPVNDSAVGGEGSAREELMAGKRGGSAAVGEWFEEIGRLSLPFFKRLIFALKALNLAGEIIEICLIHYAKKHIPGIFRTSRKRTPSSGGEGLQSENEQREVLETIITNLPTDNSLRSVGNPSRFIFGLLRAAYILNASESSRSTLERKIGSQLEQSTLDDLLIPSYSYLNETLYDVDCVERILTYFLQDIEERFAGGEDEQSSGGGRSAALMLVGKLIDGYLSEIASDANLKPEKFYDLAVSLPDHARHFDDGLYRAVDVYLKAHPWISEAEREKICGVLDYKKLTLEACTHAAQNERLPLRAVVQVLFFEQLQLRHAIAGTLMAGADDDDDDDDEGNNNDKAVVPWSYVGGEGEDEDEAARALTVGTRADEGTSAWQDAARENHVLRVDVDSMRTRVHELERECTSMKKAIQKMGPPRHVDGNCWRKKLGCKFRSQVCDSHDQVVGDARKGRAHRRDH